MCMVHVLWWPGEEGFKVSGSRYCSCSMVWGVKTEDREPKLILQQQDFLFFLIEDLAAFAESKLK